MHLAAVVEAESHVCCRYRIAAFRSALSVAGISLTILPLPGGSLARLAFFRHLRDFDGVIWQRRLISRPELFWLRRNARRLIFDFDDALWLRDSYSGKGFESRKRRVRFRAVIRAADAVVAGNSILANEASHFTTPERIAVIPTCIELNRYPEQSRPITREPLTLVWVGSSSTLQGLERNREMFEAMGRAIPGIQLKVVCDRFPRFEHLPVVSVPWSEATEVAAIASAHVGVGWVPDDPWSRGKCGLKLLQYQAAGLPVVANPVGVQAEIVRHGETGLLATTPEEWIAAVRRLREDPELASRLGWAGREQVKQRYSVVAGGALWVELLGRVLGSSLPVGGTS